MNPSSISHSNPPSTQAANEVASDSPDDSVKKSKWFFGGFFSGIGEKFTACFALGSAKKYTSVPGANSAAADLRPGAHGKPTVKATWGFLTSLTSLYHWARGITYTTVTDSTPISAEDTDEQQSQINMSGSYVISDSENLKIVSEQLQKTQKNARSAQIDKERGVVVVENKTQGALFSGDETKINNFNTNLEEISHQGLLASLVQLFRKGNPPAGACLLPTPTKTKISYSINPEGNEVTLAINSNHHTQKKAMGDTMYAANAPLEKNSNIKNSLIVKEPGIGTTQMEIKAKLNKDGSIDMNSLECTSIRGSWQIGARSAKEIKLTAVTVPGEKEQKVSVPRQGLSEVSDPALLEVATKKIQTPVDATSSTFAADVNRGYVHQGDEVIGTGTAFLENFSKKIHDTDSAKTKKLEADLYAHCNQNLLSGTKEIFTSANSEVIAKRPKNSVLITNGEGKNVETTFHYHYVATNNTDDPEKYPYGKIEIEVEQKFLKNGKSLVFISKDGQSISLLDPDKINVSGSTFTKIVFVIQEDGGVAKVNEQGKSALAAAEIQTIETSWQMR